LQKQENWLSGRKVLISLAALNKPDWESRTFSVNLTCEQVRNSPDIDTERPVFRQHEVLLHEYYQWPLYWESSYVGTFGLTPYPLFVEPMPAESSESEKKDDPHLRSTRQVTDYVVHATDSEIGHVTDFLVDDETWEIHSLVIDTGEWLPGRKALISRERIKSINWADRGVHVDVSRESIKNSPEFDVSKPQTIA